MARTFQTDGNPVGARLQRPGTPGEKRQVIPYQALCDYAGRESQVSGFGDLVTGQKHPDVSVVFNYFIDPQFAIPVTTGTGAVGIDVSRLKLSTTAGAGQAQVTSKRDIIYRMGHEAQAMFTCAFGASGAGLQQMAGVYDDNDGYFISLSETGVLQTNHRVGGVTTTYNQADFNIDTLNGDGLSDFTLNPQALNIYRISYGYLGSLPAIFELYGGTTLGWVPFHTIDTINKTADLLLQSPNLPIRFDLVSDGTNDGVMYSGSWTGASIGAERDRSLNDQFGFEVPASIAAGAETVIGSMRVKSLFQGKANKIPIDFHNISGGFDGTKPHIVRVYRNTGLTGANWQNLIGDTSVVEIDLVGTLTGVTAAQLKYATAVSKDGTIDHEFATGELRLSTGDTLTFTVESANTSDIVLAGQWDELR